MQCPRCQHENPATAKFCEECAAPLARACSNCSTPLSPTAKFCSECAHPVAARLAEPRFASPQSYTPRHLAEKILTSRSAFEGERKQVTVLFADLKGSMELLADRDPEDARKLLDPVLEHMMEAVHRYEGTVNQVMGDGIMALFGAPLAHEDHAVRACYAALRMQESVKQYAENVLRSHGVTVRIRVGLNSGEVVVRTIGSDLHMDYTAVGQTTHLAARMEQLADPGTILLPPATLLLVEGYVEVKGRGAVPVKGLAEPVQVYELVGAGSVRSRLQAAASRGLTRFVDRDPEMEQLRLALERAGRGHGQIVAVVGEAGVGKSRLYWEFTHSHHTDGWLVLESRSISYGQATSYLPVIDLLKGYFQMDTRDDPRRMREKITGKILSLDEGLRPTLPALLALLDLPVEEPTWRALDPPQRRRQTLDAIKHLLLRESQVQPLAIVFEDLHWVDSETQALLSSLVESLASSRILLLVNYRPEYQHGWGGKTYYAQLRIDPLPPENAGALLGSLLGGDPALQPLTRLLIDRTDGNPFFLEESVRDLVETGTLLGERGAYRLAATLPNIQLPATVQTVVAARIDRLPPEEKRLLQSAAVIGKDVPFALLQAIAELSEHDLRRNLGHLQAAEFLYEASLFPDLEYTFKHALTYEVAYGSLLRERRKILHRTILSAIERLNEDRLGEHVERLAEHAVAGEVWDKAVDYLRGAGAKAYARGAVEASLIRYERALEVLPQLTSHPDHVRQAIDARVDIYAPLLVRGRISRLITLHQEAEVLARQLDDQVRLGHILCRLGGFSWIAATYERAISYLIQATQVAVGIESRELRIMANQYLAQSYVALGEYQPAIDLLKGNVDGPESALGKTHLGFSLPPYIDGCCWLAWCLAEIGDFADALSYADRAVAFADELRAPQAQAPAYAFRAKVLVDKGDLDEGLDWSERAVSVCASQQILIWLPLALTTRGLSLAHLGRHTEAIPDLERGAVLLEEVGVRAYLSRIYVQWALGLHLGASPSNSVRVAERARELALVSGERACHAEALFVLAAANSVGGAPANVAAGCETYQRSLNLAVELGMRPLVAHCHLGLGKLYRRTGKRDEAGEHLTTATTMYREMDMRFWLEQAEAEMKECT